MQTTSETAEILNDLIQINNDRIVGYERALKELKDDDDDLKTLFEGFIDESRQNKMALGTEVEVAGEDMDEGTTASGKIYRAWMDVKNAFTGNTRHQILASCEFGEDAAQKAYTTAMESDNLPAYLKEMIAEQQKKLKEAHDEVKALRDATK